MSPDVSKSRTSMTITATIVIEQKVESVGGGFHAYSLIEMPTGEANAAIVNLTKAQEPVCSFPRIAGIQGT